MTRDEILAAARECHTDRKDIDPYLMRFSRHDGTEIGRLEFAWHELVFTGSADESARVFFDALGNLFAEKLAEARKQALEDAAKRIESPLHNYADVIRKMKEGV